MSSSSRPVDKRPANLQPVPLQTSTSSSSRELLVRGASSPMASHRHSISQDLRGLPSSPRNRHASVGQQALQDLFNHPPPAHKADSPFAGRDWKSITVGEVVDPSHVLLVDIGTSVEEATKLLVNQGSPNVILINDSPDSRVVTGTFDYSHLNAFLLMVVGLGVPEEGHIDSLNEIAKKGREGKTIYLRDIQDLGRKEPLITLPQSSTLTRALEHFSSGVHRIIITNDHDDNVVGVLTQLRLMGFFWDHGRAWSVVEQLYASTLADLHVGSRNVKSINGDRPLTDALELMHRESITSLPVLDSHSNVVGNISQVDVRLLTTSASLPLLRSSCIHFISVILSSRGMQDGKDSFPVFWINSQSTLAHTVAKLVATVSHRMWIVESPSPASSTPQTPMAESIPPASIAPPSPAGTYAPSVATVSNAGPSGQRMSGQLSGVVSLTDVLNLIARASGLTPHEPDEARRQRRRSSSSSVRPSIDSTRSSSVDLGQKGNHNQNGRR